MKKLVIGQIPDDFDPVEHIAVSPACFIGRENIYPDFENMSFIDSYDNLDELVNLDHTTSQEALHLVPSVAKKYNPEVFNNYSLQFWKTIYYPFLGLLVPWLYRKQNLADKLINKYGNDSLEVSIGNNTSNLKYSDSYHTIIDGLWNPGVNEWVISQLLVARIPKKWKVRYHEIVINSNDKLLRYFKLSTSYKHMVKRRLKNIFFRSNGVYGFSLWHEIIFHLLISVKPKKNNHCKKDLGHVSSSIKWQVDIESIIDKLLPEDLKNLRLEENHAKGYSPGKIINYSNRLYYDTESILSAAHAYENNCVVAAAQHGGHNYGSALTFEYGKNVEFNSDYFFTWGYDQWEGKTQENFIPLPSPLLSKHLNNHVNKSGKIILVGTNMNCYPTRYDSGLSEVNMMAYRKNKVEFLNAVPKVKVYYRPYLNNLTGLHDWEYVKQHSNNIIKVEGDLHKEIQYCNLLVLDHPGTTMNIAMAMNTPTICFWNRTHFPFNNEANKFLDKLEKSGLYFEHPAEAANKVNELIRDFGNEIHNWWNQNDIQSLRKSWMTRYSQADKNWVRVWSKAIWRL